MFESVATPTVRGRAKPTTASPRKTTTTKTDAGYWQSSTADEEKQIFRVNTAALRFKPTPLPRSSYLGRAATTKIEANILNKRPNDACTDRRHLCCQNWEASLDKGLGCQMIRTELISAHRDFKSFHLSGDGRIRPGLDTSARA